TLSARSDTRCPVSRQSVEAFGRGLRLEGREAERERERERANAVDWAHSLGGSLPASNNPNDNSYCLCSSPHQHALFVIPCLVLPSICSHPFKPNNRILCADRTSDMKATTSKRQHRCQ